MFKVLIKTSLIISAIIIASCSETVESKQKNIANKKTNQEQKTERVNMLDVKEIDQQTVLKITNQTQSEFQIIDVRTPEEYQAGHIKNAINIPHDNILQNPSLLEPYQDKELILYCRSGRRVSFVTDSMQSSSFKQVHHLTGDMQAWQQNELPMVVSE